MGVGVEEAIVGDDVCWWPSGREVVCSSFCFLLCSSTLSLVFRPNCLKLSRVSSDWLGGDNAGERGEIWSRES